MTERYVKGKHSGAIYKITDKDVRTIWGKMEYKAQGIWQDASAFIPVSVIEQAHVDHQADLSRYNVGPRFEQKRRAKVWDGYAQAALQGALVRWGNRTSTAAWAGNWADRMMAERDKRFPDA